MARACLYALCAWLLVVPAALANIIVNWLDDPIVLFHGRAPNIEVPIDLDGAGLIDFTFGASISFVGVRSEGQNRYVIEPSPPPNIGGAVVPLYPDYEIGPELEGYPAWFGTNTAFAPLGIWLWPSNDGPFLGHHAYMGVEFYIDDHIHYGWINLWVAEGGPYGEIYGWAYESNPNTPIIAGAIPEPNTFLLLFMSGLVLGASRRYG